MAIPIISAADKPLTNVSSSVPNMSQTLNSWMQPITFEKLVKTVVNFQVVETTTPVDFQGVWQPFTARQLNMRPEGERKWKWFTVHAQLGAPLEIDDVVIYKGVQYRIAEKLIYTEYGYEEYHINDDYTGSGPTVVVGP